MTIHAPRPAIAEIARSMEFFVPPGQLGEVRIIPPDRSQGPCGFFFRHEEIPAAARLAEQHDPLAKGVYLVMNQVDPAILGERRTLEVVYSLTKDDNILRRLFLLIDCDPKSPERGANDSATDDEKLPSFEVRESIFQYLGEMGFPEPAFFDSGNGGHMIYQIDLANDFESHQLIQVLLNALARKFNTEQVSVDITVHNASRITKLYGTVARKGEHRETRPHRLSTIQSIPDAMVAVSRELLIKAIATLNLEANGGELIEYAAPASGNLHDFVPTKPKLILPPTFIDGQKHYNMTSLAGALRSFGSTEEEIYQTLLVFKRTRCTQDFNNDGLKNIARDYARKDCNLSMKAMIECASEDKAEAAERQQKLKLALEHATRQIGQGTGTDEVLIRLRSVIEQAAASQEIKEFKAVTSAELDAADLRTDYLIENVLASGQSGIIAGGKKSLKTNISIDLTLSLASGDKFLNQFYVTRPARVGLMSGESGDATIQETARRIVKSKQWKNLSDYENAIWSFELPRLGQPQTRRELAKFITDNGLEILIVDPAYLCLDVGDGAANIFAMGPKLLELTQISAETKCTFLIVHHCKKNANDPFKVPELEDIAWSGFQEWARQWILLGRREPYDAEQTGSHKLWLNVGGSAGHSGLWGLDIEEGSRLDKGGRRWDVTMDGASKIIAENIDQRESKKEERTQSKAEKRIANDAERMLQQYLRKAEGDTLKACREAIGLSGSRSGPANAKLLADGSIEPCEIVKAGRKYDAFRVTSKSVGTSGTDAGPTGTDSASPDGGHAEGFPPYGGNPGPAHRDVQRSLSEVASGFVPDEPSDFDAALEFGGHKA